MTAQPSSGQVVGRARAIQAVKDRMAELDPPLSTSSLAQRTGLSRDTLTYFLDGQRWPQRAKRALIERVLGWPSGRIEELASEAVSHSSEHASGVDSDLVGFLEEADRNLTDAEREVYLLDLKAYARRRYFEIRGEL